MGVTMCLDCCIVLRLFVINVCLDALVKMIECNELGKASVVGT